MTFTASELQAMTDLANTPEAHKVSAATRGKTEVAFEQEVKEYVEVAKNSGVPPEHWVIKVQDRYYSSQTLPLRGVMSFLLKKVKTSRAVQVLFEAGCNPWLESIVGSAGANVEYTEGANIASYIMGGQLCSRYNVADATLAGRKVVIKSALKSASARQAVEVFNQLSSRYNSIVAKSSKTAKGVLGSADKEARDAALVVVHGQAEMLAAAAVADAANGGHQLGTQIAEIIKDATERLNVKQDKANAVVNPEKLKKQMSAADKSRAAALIYLCRHHAHDDELIKLSFEASVFLEQNPMIASLRLPKVGGVLQAALAAECNEALAYLEKAGANIWLAAAQEGSSNACEWVLQTVVNRYSGTGNAMERVARLLLIGSWLDGADDPKGRCIELANEVINRKDNHHYYFNKERAEQLVSEMERQTLEEILGDLPMTEAAPRKRSAL